MQKEPSSRTWRRLPQQAFTHLPAALKPALVDARFKPIDIVWSRRMSPNAGSGIDIDRSPARVTEWNASSPSTSQTASDAVPMRAAVSSVPQKLTDVDPRLLERLTDDVIRRVERRVRIERERRGL